MNVTQKTLFCIGQGSGWLRCSAVVGTRITGLSRPFAPGQGAVDRSGVAVPWRRQRAHGPDSQIPCTARLELCRRNPSRNTRTATGRFHLPDGNRHAPQQGSVVRVDLAIAGSAGRIRPWDISRIRAKRLSRKNATFSPRDGTEGALISPRDGTGKASTVPPDGTIRGVFGCLSSPPDGHPLEIPSHHAQEGRNHA